MANSFSFEGLEVYQAARSLVRDYCFYSYSIFSLLTINRHITKMTGNTDASKSPFCMLFSPEVVPSPTSDGPTVPPTSPARASNAKSAVPPQGIRAEVRLIEPGHMMATAKPLTIQPAKAMSGTDDRAAIR